MSTSTHYQTAPEDRIALKQKSAYAMGMLVNNLQAAALPAMVVILNLGLGMDVLLVGLISAIPRVFDAVSDPLLGYISDNTRTRWGRRRPFIFVGAIVSGLIFAVMWQLPSGYVDLIANELLSVTGLSNAQSLQWLNLSWNYLEELTLDNPSLEVLSATHNQLGAVDLAKATNLKNLLLRINELSEIDLRANTRLETLILSGNQIEGADLSQNNRLTHLYMSGNLLAELDVTNNQNLIDLRVHNNPNLSCIQVGEGQEIPTVSLSEGQQLRVDCW